MLPGRTFDAILQEDVNQLLVEARTDTRRRFA
jgi:hypothetical protein